MDLSCTSNTSAYVCSRTHKALGLSRHSHYSERVVNISLRHHIARWCPIQDLKCPLLVASQMDGSPSLEAEMLSKRRWKASQHRCADGSHCRSAAIRRMVGQSFLQSLWQETSVRP